ncbi:hypothetical protein QE152_g13372 [Popillia japonica]|uniref:Uncharacterized protein n=1 Tax=Popillia japonica TaxID=7064 RepID=A0AAW1LCW8_POPJA
MATENKTDTASKMESVDIVKMFEMLVIENKRRDKIMEDMLHHIVQQANEEIHPEVAAAETNTPEPSTSSSATVNNSNIERLVTRKRKRAIQASKRDTLQEFNQNLTAYHKEKIQSYKARTEYYKEKSKRDEIFLEHIKKIKNIVKDIVTTQRNE